MNRWFSNQWKPIRSLWKLWLKAPGSPGALCSAISWLWGLSQTFASPLWMPSEHLRWGWHADQPKVDLNSWRLLQGNLKFWAFFFLNSFFWMCFFFFTSVYSELNGPFFAFFLLVCGIWCFLFLHDFVSENDPGFFRDTPRQVLMWRPGEYCEVREETSSH